MIVPLLIGTFFAPLFAQAWSFSSLLGNEASADTNVIISSKNSQTIVLLRANVSPTPASKDTKDNTLALNYDSNSNIMSDNALLPTTSSLGAFGGIGGGDSSFDQVSIYVVRKGDSLSQIAEMYNVSVNTILVANNIKRGQKIVPGDMLFILPISGLEHTVTKGQTLKSIAKLYKVEVSDITIYNGIAEDAKLAVGDELMIPGGEMYDEGGDKPTSNLSTAVARDMDYYKKNPVQDLAGYFINPVPTGHKTQGLHGPGKRGIDIGAPTGTPIFAAADGRVSLVSTGWSGGYGNMVIVTHPNGTKTLYAHMSKVGTYTGAQVSQGEVIGFVGSTGRSTGPHIHFEVFNAKNPGSNWSWAR